MAENLSKIVDNLLFTKKLTWISSNGGKLVENCRQFVVYKKIDVNSVKTRQKSWPEIAAEITAINCGRNHGKNHPQKSRQISLLKLTFVSHKNGWLFWRSHNNHFFGTISVRINSTLIIIQHFSVLMSWKTLRSLFWT
jgi:hypothetical protein